MKNEKKINYLAVDNQSALNSYGTFFFVGNAVRHDGASEIAIIESFEIDKESNEVLVHTTLGTCHLDFLTKAVFENAEIEKRQILTKYIKTEEDVRSLNELNKILSPYEKAKYTVNGQGIFMKIAENK